MYVLGFPGGTVVKNLPASAGDTRDMGSISGSGRLPGVEMAIHSNIFAWEIPWTEEPGGLQSMGSQSWMDMTEHVRTHVVVLFFKFQGTFVFFSIWLHQFTFLVVVVDKGSFFFKSSPMLIIFCFW